MKRETWKKESRFLDQVYHTYKVCDSPTEAAMRRLILQTLGHAIPRGRALELGCSDGMMTKMIAERVGRLDVVDGSRKFLRKASQRKLPNARFIYSLFERFRCSRKYDCIFASYILEHVLDPVEVLGVARKHLKRDGTLFIVVPNARALSRQLAAHMGLLPDLKALTENDESHGHRRVYDRVSLNRDIEAAGFQIVQQGGILLKLLADFQMDELIRAGILKEQHIQGLQRLGSEYPDLCGSLYAICRQRK